MRRVLFLAAFLLVLALIPVCAQRGGGHAGGGGGHASFSSGHSGFNGGFSGHASGGFSASHFGSGSFSSSHFARGGFSSGRRAGGTHVFIRTYPNRFGYGRGYGYPYYGYLDPYWWWDSYSSYDPDYEQDRQIASEMNDENLELQDRLRAQEMYPRRPAPAAQERAENDPATVLIFRDQHQQEIQNYAIVDGLLWNFTPQRTEKIPLAILDLPATKRANEDRGVEFHLPAASEGQ